MKKVTKTMVTMLAVLCAACSLVAANQQSATEDIAAFEAGLQAIASKPKLMSAKLLSATSGTTVYPTSNSDMNKTGNHTTPLDLYFDVTMASVSSATLYLNAYDVDYPSATEDDEVYFNGTPIGRLQGYDGGMNMNTFNLPANIVKIGSNHVHIDVSVNPSGWITQIREGTKLVLNGEEGRVTLTVSKDLLNKIELNWSANYSGAAPYNIYRGKTSDNLTIYREGLTVTSFTDTDIVPGDTYYYQIKTKSGVSSTIEEAKSVKASVAVTPTQGLYHKVAFTWTTENCTGPFTVYRGDTQENLLDARLRWMVGKDIVGNIFEENVDGGRDWFYQVVASDGTASEPVRVSVKLAEIKLKVTIDQDDGVKLTWTCPVDGLGYYVCRSASPVNEWEDYTGQYEMLTKDWLGHNKLIYRNNYFDDRASEGCEYAYYVVSSLGVASNIEYGRRENTYRAPSFSFRLKGDVHPSTTGTSGETDILIAGRNMTCEVFFSDLGRNCEITGFELVGKNVSGNRVNKRESHKIRCHLDSGFNFDWGWVKSDWVSDMRSFTLNPTITFGARLLSGKGYHGEYEWSIVCKCVIDGHERDIKAIDDFPCRRNVYFEKDKREISSRRGAIDKWDANQQRYVTDFGEKVKVPNWFVYWNEDGACPGLKNNHVYYRGKTGLGGQSFLRENAITLDAQIPQEWTPFELKDTAAGTWTGDRWFHVLPDGRYERGIYNVESTIAHEVQHKKTYDRYCEQRKRTDGGQVDSDGPDKVLPGGNSLCVFKQVQQDGSHYGACTIQQNSAEEYTVCDRIVDMDEVNLSYWRSLGLDISGISKDEADTFGFGSMYSAWWSYGGYGDDELIARVAGRKALLNANPANDWAYPGEQSGGLRLAPAKSKMKVKNSSVMAVTSEEDSEQPGDNNVYVTIGVASVNEIKADETLMAIEYRLDISLRGCSFLRLEATLVDSDSNVVARTSTVVEQGMESALLAFAASDLFESGCNGAVTIGEVTVLRECNFEDVAVGVLYDFKLDPIQINREELARVPGGILDPVAIVRVENDLKTTIPVKCNIAGEYELVGELSDTNGNYVARARVSQAMAVGTNEVSLTFVGAEIYNSAHDGPYVLSSVQLWSDDEMIDAATDLLTTEVAYSYEDFKPADTVVTVDRESAAFASPAVLSDGALGALTFSFDVNNEAEDSLCYRLAATLDGATGETVAMQNGKYVYLEPGVNHIEVTFSASAIAEKGIDGPYMMGLIELVHQDDLGNDLSFRPMVATEAYKASDFAAAAVAFSNEPSAKRVLECDIPTVVLPFEAKRACTVVASATLIGTNGEFIARASATNRCDAAGAQTAEIVFPREALVAAGQQGPFSVGYFALLPLVDGEEPIYSDTFEVTGVEWIDWEGMFDWAFEGGTAQAALYKGTNGVVRVPSFVKGRDVISVGPCCFLDCECVAEIILPVGIAEVGIGAFFGTSLSAVELPESVATVGNAAFNVEGLELVVFDGPPPMSAPDAYPKGAVGTYSAAYAATWEAELKGGCLWNGLTMVPEGADADGYRTESGWTVIGPEDAAACEGKRTFRSAETADGASSAMTMDVEEQTSVSFWWKTSCEGARMDDWQGDHAEFLIDGVVVERIAGESCWKQVVVNISDPGQHELSWRYVKDGAGASGADCVWVSDVGFATAAGEMTHAELLAEADYNWFYENGPVECGGETPFEYIPEKPLPERTLAQIDILCDLGIRSVVDTEDAEVSDSAQTAFCRCANGEGLDFAVWTADGWMRVGNALVGAQQGEARVTICLDYSVTPSQFACKVNNHTLTNENGQSSFVCAKQDCRVNEIATDSDGAGRIVAWAGRYDASNSEILEIAEGTEAECDSDLSNLPRETFQVSGGGTLVIKGADVPTTGVKARLHVDQNSALRFDYSGFSSLPSVLTLFSGVGNDFMLQGNVSIVVPGEGSDRLSKLCVKDGNLEAHIAERPEIVTEGGSESPFAVDGENGSACLNVGNAVEGFWYGLLTTGVLTSDFVLDPDSVKQCTGTGSLRLESSVNANSDSGFYRVSVSAEKP